MSNRAVLRNFDFIKKPPESSINPTDVTTTRLQPVPDFAAPSPQAVGSRRLPSGYYFESRELEELTAPTQDVLQDRQNDERNTWLHVARLDRIASIASRYKPSPEIVGASSAGTGLSIAIQEWEGAVTSIEGDFFHATLRDRTRNISVGSETATIPLDEVDSADRDLLRVGAIFYLSMRRQIQVSGRHINAWQLVFRRLPAWQRSTLNRIEAEAKDIATFFASAPDE